MSQSINAYRSWLAALLTLCLGACADASDRAGVPDQGAPQIEQVPEALGGFTELWNGANGETPLCMSSTWTAFKHVSAGCEQIDAIQTSSGQAASVQALPTCGTITAAGGDGTLFVGTSAQKIYSTGTVAGGAGAGGPGPIYAWQLIVSTSGSNISKILSDSTKIYWQDSSGIYRAPRNGGTSTKIGFSNRTLLAVDGSVLWVQRDDGGGQYSLRTISTGTGSPELTVATNTMPFASGFFVEDSYVWWVENGAADGYNRLRRLTKADKTVATMKLSTTVTYQLPMRAGTVLYYVDKNISNGTVTMRSHNFTTGVQTSAPVSVLDVLHMVLGSSVFFTAQTSASPARYDLKAGSL
jgi:hypothetical protein